MLPYLKDKLADNRQDFICPGTDCLQPNFAQDITYKIIAQ